VIEFKQYGKTSRLFRDVVITEKIDGTNSAVIIEKVEPTTLIQTLWNKYFGKSESFVLSVVEHEGEFYNVAAQSRNRLIVPGKTTDNYGFARWVQANAEQLVTLLGGGRHYGEWWGQGIARKYDMQRKSFSLFNTHKHRSLVVAELVGDAYLTVVPTLYEGEFNQDAIFNAMHNLFEFGSVASPGFKKPEGICIFHEQSKQVFKVTLDNQDKGKWELV